MRELTKIDLEKDRIEFLDSRFYQHPITKDFYPSVTTILSAYPKSEAFYDWLKKVGDDADEVRDEAGRKGSVVHQLTEDFDMDKEVKMLDDFNRPKFKQIEWAMFERYVDFRTRFNFEMIANEVHYISQTYGYAGTLDRVFNYEGKNWLIDIKTSNSLHNHYWLQMAAYAKMWEEFNELKIDNIGVLWLNAKTRTEGKGNSIQGVGWQLAKPEYGIDHYFDLFKSVFATWKAENKNIMPKNKSYKLSWKLRKAS